MVSNIKCGEIQYAHKIITGDRKTDTQLAGEIPISTRGYSKLKRPGYRQSFKYLPDILKLHRELINSPFPEYLERLFGEYEIARSTNQMTLKNFIEKDIDLLLSFVGSVSQLRNIGIGIDVDKSIEYARLNWLVGFMLADSSSKWGHHDDELAATAREYMQTAVNLLTEHREHLGMFAQYYVDRVEHAIVSSLYNTNEKSILSCKNSRASFIKTLQEKDYFNVIESILEVVPTDHLVVRNSILAGAVTEDIDYISIMLQRLIKLDSRFSDPDYKPTPNTPSFREELIMQPYLNLLFTSKAA
ncbi:hypothetical protein A9Q90_03795 [Gammaproteobacteria bacterium 54_18_T64]|nr:hypothetical protein A9Q90_03795 [Gammaproteobacteria bacterium 54_18_T64]